MNADPLDKLPIANGAEYGSYEDQYKDECLLGTRTQLLQQIMEWALSSSQKSIFWLNGMAGTGKSTISRTVARGLKENDHLGASFFFKRGEGDRGNVKRFFSTLIRQLMLRMSELRSSVREALFEDPEIASKSLGEQFEKLLLQPLLKLDQLHRSPQNAVVVIDALDECDCDHNVRSLLRLLPLLQKAKTLRLRVFLTSRPELPIRLSFAELEDHDYQDIALHKISEKATEHDIRLFLTERFKKIRSDKNVREGWPGDRIIQNLVGISTPLFISAATIYRYIENTKCEPIKRLTDLLQSQARCAAKMDKTYLPILERLLDNPGCDMSEKQQILQEFQNIVGTIILLATPFSVNTLSRFLGIEPHLIIHRLDSFQSVLIMPTSRDIPVRILHISFRDFLVQSKSIFRVDEPRKHKEIALKCLQIMKSHLRKDICYLGSDGIHRADIDPQYLHRFLSPELEYSCHYWVHHFKQSNISSAEIEDIFIFLKEHFLHWVEAMSLLGFLSEVVILLNALQMIPQVSSRNLKHN
jgi:type II secretory pathway predicted ATPase ExeA